MRRVRLGEVLRLRKEIVHPHDGPRGTGIFVGLEHLESGTGRRSGSLEVDLANLTGRKPKFYRGDIVYGYLRPYLNKVWVAEFDGLCSVDQYVYEVDRTVVDAEFIAWFMRSSHYLARAPVAAGPGQLPRIRLEEVAQVEVDLPDLTEQRQIVAMIKRQMAAAERARAAAEAQLEAAIAFSAAHLRIAFKRIVARDWPKRRLADICRLLPSRSIANDGDTPVRAITTACLGEDGFRPEGLKLARMWAADAAECIVGKGEVLVARSNTADLVGRACLFDGDPAGTVASDLTIRIQAGAEMHPGFVASFFSFLYVTGYWRDKAGGASGSMKKITRGQLESQWIFVPSLEEQVRVSRALSEASLAGRRARQKVEEQTLAIEATKVALMRRAFS